ncbi:MAG: 50S ribosomal protein L11 methyltransferase [Bacteroidales bacterium]|nr:50S ribosomal protein L11 methyltransferase [Bacteroidales bacterium]
MYYLELSITFQQENPDQSEILMAELADVGFDSFVEGELVLKAYILREAFEKEKLGMIEARYQHLFPFSYDVSPVEQKNWNQVWESGFHPVLIKNKCLIYAPFHTNLPDVAYKVLIEPKMSFGTGHHATTTLMVEYLLELNMEGETILDMGCGTGVLGILASMRGAKGVTAVDIDDWCIDNTLENAQRNNIANLTALKGDIDDLAHKKFNHIVANINRNVLLAHMPHYANMLNAKGTLLLSGFYTSDINAIVEQAVKHGLKKISEKEHSNWAAVCFQKV